MDYRLSTMDSVKHLPFFVRCVYGLFFVSGALGLVYEVLWLRKLLLVFGSTVHAVSTVLTVFFGGLALGSWLFGRWIDRHETAGLLWYAACEAGIGVYAFVTLPLFEVIEQVYIPLYRASGFSPAVLVGASFVCSVFVLLIPTTLMGGTFPILSRFLIRTAEERGVKIASLYGINTAGAVAGTLFVYYLALQRLGWLATLQCAGLSNLLIGIVARALNRNLQLAGFRTSALGMPKAQSTEPAEQGKAVYWLFVAFGLSGFSAMVYEVAWTRSLSLVLGSSIYAFCLMLATFLGGIALGSFAARQFLRTHPASVGQFGVLEACLAAYGLFSISLFGWLPEWLVRLWPVFGRSFLGLSWLQVGLSMSVMALPTFFMGLLFPIVSDLVTGRFAQLGRRLGLVYAINTLGGILGSFLCGFWLIPQMGIAWTLVLAAIINLLAGLLIYLRFSPGWIIRRVGLTIASLALYLALGKWVFLPSWQQQVLAAGAYLDPSAYRDTSVEQVSKQHKLLFYRESLNATVSVHKSESQIYLKVGGKTDASTGIDMGTQVLSAHIPLLLHRNPTQVLVIGLGSGVTLGSAGRYPVSVLHCAEIDPAVVEGARFFADHNYQIHDDPRTRFYVADGRNFLLASRDQYDVIISEPSNPWMAGLAYLFTREFYELSKQRLAPGGIMCQWIQLYRMFPADVKLLLKTFQEAFPYTSVWSTIPGDLVVIGSLEPHQLDYERLKAQLALPAIQQDLERVSLAHPRALLEFFWLGPEQVRKLVADVTWVHEDDQPWVEFSAPKALYLGPTFDLNYAGIERFKAPTSTIAPNVDPTDEDVAFYEALGAAYQFRLDWEEAIEAFERAVSLDPGRSKAYVRLGELYARRGLDLKAQEALTKALQLDPKLVEAYPMLARIWRRGGKLEQAIEIYEQVARMKAPESLLAEEIGTALRQAKRPLEAVEYFRSALSQEGSHRPSLLLALADVFKELKRWDEAERVLTVAMSQHPDAAAFPLILGEVLLEQDRRLEAKRLFEQVLAKAPKTPEAYFGLGEIAFKEGDLKQATRYLLSGLRYGSYNVEALETLQAIQKNQSSDG